MGSRLDESTRSEFWCTCWMQFTFLSDINSCGLKGNAGALLVSSVSSLMLIGSIAVRSLSSG